MSEIPDDVKKLAHITAETVLRNLPDDYAQAIMLDRSTRPSTGEVGVRVRALDWDDFGTEIYAAVREMWFGYRISLKADRTKVLRRERLGNITDELGVFNDWDVAMSAAQADFNRLMTALTAPPATVATGEGAGRMVAESVYLSAVKGRQDFREAMRLARPVLNAARALRDKWRTKGQRVDGDDFFAAIHAVSEAADAHEAALSAFLDADQYPPTGLDAGTIEAIRADERERCAKVADEHISRPNLLPLCNDDMNRGAERGRYEAAEEIAAAIRSLTPPTGGRT